ncbi:MAG: phenylalanine--tRNA ligase subunit beta, partial [Bacteroidales bacterium]|nr:phenylalanine--tRNA ligase subunit beta [Bacteroidales bacterium]
TKNVFIESAYFKPVSIRKTSKRHGLKTDSSFRFERGVDPQNTLYGLKRAAMLIKELAGGEISSDIVDVYPQKIEKAKVEIEYSYINRLVGKVIPNPIVKQILTLMDFVIVDENDKGLTVEVPGYRVDVKCPADVVEEILRIYGYNNVEINDHVNSVLEYGEKPDSEKLINTISDMLSSNGFSEIMCNSLNPASFYEHEAFDSKALVVLSNPLSSDLNAMRQSLLYGGLNTIARNINRQNVDLRLYEFGNIYSVAATAGNRPCADDYIQKKALDIFISGNLRNKRWNSDNVATNFFNVKTAVDKVLARLGVKNTDVKTLSCDKKYFSEAISYSIKDKEIAEFGSVSSEFLKMFDINQNVYYGHIDWDNLVKVTRKNKVEFTELPKYPWVRRDLALLVDKSVKFEQIKDIAYRTERRLLKNVDLFDVYESAILGVDKKSYAVSFILRDDNNTLTDKNIDKVMNNLINALEKGVDAKIR